MSLLLPETEANAPSDEAPVPDVYRSLNFRSLQEPYNHSSHDTMASRYSTLDADSLEVMLNGGLERFYKKFNHLSRKINLQLPTPEFDNILMIHEGHMVYHGPRTEILDYYRERGFTCPPRVDPADFLIEVTSGRGQRYANGSVPLKALPVTAEEFNALFCQSAIYKKTMDAIAKGFNEHQFESAEDYKKAHSVVNLARSKDRSEFGLAFIQSTLLLLNRQKLNWLRDPPLLWGKIIEAILVGLVLGMIYYEVDSKYYLRMIFFSIALFQRQAWQQITISFQLRKVFYKQRPRNFFRTSSYAIAETVVQVPVNLTVSFILGTFFYFMSGLTRSFEKYIVFYLVLACFQHAISAYMTLLSALSPSITVGQALASISVSFFLLFSGNIILADLIPDYWIWMYWFNPLAWALRSNMLSEFSSHRYTPEQSKKLLDSFSIKQGTEYIWFGVGILLGYYLLFTTLNALALHHIRYEKYSGVSVKTSVDSVKQEEVYVEVNTPGAVEAVKAAKGSGLPFTPSNLCIRDLEYFVTLPSGEEKQLLHGITAHFEPGRMVALMGSSGAGKTTLMDVIAGRKTGGRIVGDIIVNGEPKNPANFSRITAYCEQMDIHSEAASIYEALVFSANLRLPPTFTKEEHLNLVNETLDLLELTPIASSMVGQLSVEQKKRVTIGVEVVSNPSILFLDEPTSGLDARSALIVMRGVQSIARTGRTVLCTIHQPSISIFELFDGLLLLQKGGYTAYFGDLGVDSVKMLEYFASIPGTQQIHAQYNPATYMMEVIGAGIGRDVKDYSVEYKNSELGKTNRDRTLQLCEVSEGFVRHSTLNYKPIATGFWNQLGQLAKKQQLTYWRSPQYNFMRMLLFPLFAIIFGTTFYQLSAGSLKKINSHIGLIYNSMDFIGVINLMTVIEVTCAERAVYYRERMSNYYSPLPYSLSLWFAEIPYLIVVIVLFVTIEYWLVGWSDNAGDFFFFMFIFYLYTSICTYVGQWMSALMPNEKVANVAVGALSCLFNLFSGFLLPRTAMKPGYKWFQYLMPSYYSLSALAGIQFGDDQHMIAVTTNGTTVNKTVAEYIHKTYDYHPERKYDFMAGLLVIWVVLQVAIYLTFKFVSHLKR
ncbi:ABC transporter G family member 37 [Phytophthora fragariae]|uniref:ABC transporter G family member 37 n=1 Tax=Phytophthora fragariae TaxID=53985 RepID=A0A6A3TGC1_9STRA|nr:ABC transporter G family member 37 [Phytophthora fragariae]